MRRALLVPGVVLGMALGLAAGCRPERAAAPVAAAVARTYESERRALDDAIAHGLDLARSRPDDGLMPYEVVTLHLERARLAGDYDDFARAQALLDARPASARATAVHCLAQARLHYALHRLRAAGDTLASCPAGTDLAERVALAADLALYSGRYREAESAYRSLVNDVGLPAHFVRLALLRARTGSPAEAAALLEAAERRYQGPSATMRAWLKLQRGLVALGRGRLDEALALYRLASDALPGWWLVDEHIAEVMALRGDVTQARALYRNVVERTGHPEYLDALAALEEAGGQPEDAARRRGEARAAYERRLAAFPEAAAGHALEHFLRDPASTSRALALAKANFATRPFGEAAIALARASLHAGDAARAQALLEAELAKGWDTPETYWVLAEALAKRGREAPAQAARAAALARNPLAERLYGGGSPGRPQGESL